MPIPINLLNLPLPTDVMSQIAQQQQQATQAAFQPKLLQEQLNAQRLAESVQRQQMQQRGALFPLQQKILDLQAANLPAKQKQAALMTLLKAGLTQAQTKKALAEAQQAQRGPRTTLMDLQDAQKAFRDNLAKFGANDPRTIAAGALVIKISGLTQIPDAAQLAPEAAPATTPSGVQPLPTNTPSVNSTIAHANNQSAEVTPTQATTDINRTIPQSNVAAPEHINTAQPQIKTQQDFNAKATDVLRGLLKKANDAKDPFLQAQATGLSKEWEDISSNAQQATEHELPLYNTLLDGLHQTNLVGPAGYVNWTTPAGQRLRANMTRAQGEFIKSFHLGRMTQLEFNFLKNAIGKQTMYPSALRALFKNVMAKDIEAQQKAKVYHDYLAGGGRTEFEADANWAKQQPEIAKNAMQQANDMVEQSRLKGSKITIDQVRELAKRNNKTEDQIIDILKDKGAF